MKRILVVTVLVMSFSVMASSHDIAVEDHTTAYFGDESDYMDYISDDVFSVREVQLVGWWYPTYDEFLGK